MALFWGTSLVVAVGTKSIPATSRFAMIAFFILGLILVQKDRFNEKVLGDPLLALNLANDERFHGILYLHINAFLEDLECLHCELIHLDDFHLNAFAISVRLSLASHIFFPFCKDSYFIAIKCRM